MQEYHHQSKNGIYDETKRHLLRVWAGVGGAFPQGLFSGDYDEISRDIGLLVLVTLGYFNAGMGSTLVPGESSTGPGMCEWA